MLRSILIGSLIAVVSASLPAQEAKPQTADAKRDPASAVPPQGADQKAYTMKGGNTWFTSTEMDMGTYFGAEHAVGVFKFQNPSDTEILWRGLRGSCTCAKAVVRVGDQVYELSSKPRPNVLSRVGKDAKGEKVLEEVRQIAIGPGAKGEVEVHLDIPNVPGPRSATLDVHSTDSKLPQFQLKWSATSAKLFVVSPAEINLNKMSWNEEREFTVTVTSPLHPNFEILSMEGGGEDFDVKWDKKIEGERTSWAIHGKYGPVGTEAAGGGLLKFITDVRGRSSFSLRVMALVEGPMEVKPGGFVPLGLIRRGSELKKEVVFEPNDGVKIEATKLTFEKLTVPEEFMIVSSHNDGNKLVIELGVTSNAPRGLLKGDLVVDLNHPQVKQKRIMFNGFVR